LHAKELLAVKISICKNNPPSLGLKTFQPSPNGRELISFAGEQQRGRNNNKKKNAISYQARRRGAKVARHLFPGTPAACLCGSACK
jgi:hypothetical protein